MPPSLTSSSKIFNLLVTFHFCFLVSPPRFALPHFQFSAYCETFLNKLLSQIQFELVAKCRKGRGSWSEKALNRKVMKILNWITFSSRTCGVVAMFRAGSGCRTVTFRLKLSFASNIPHERFPALKSITRFRNVFVLKQIICRCSFLRNEKHWN